MYKLQIALAASVNRYRIYPYKIMTDWVLGVKEYEQKQNIINHGKQEIRRQKIPNDIARKKKNDWKVRDRKKRELRKKIKTVHVVQRNRNVFLAVCPCLNLKASFACFRERYLLFYHRMKGKEICRLNGEVHRVQSSSSEIDLENCFFSLS